MKASFLRKRKMARGVLVLDGNLSSLGPHLTNKNFRVVKLPVGPMDADSKSLFLSHRTLLTKAPRGFEDDVPVLEYSLIDASGVTADDETLASIISRVWTSFRLKSAGWFLLRLRHDGDHKIEFPE